MTEKIVEEKRASVERYGEKPTRYMRPVDFVIYDPLRNKDFLERQQESALVSQLLSHLLVEKHTPTF